MKAASCPQCEGLISEVAERQTIVQCEYCGAKVLIRRESVPIQPAVDKTVGQPASFANDRRFNNFAVLIVIAGAAIIGIGLMIFAAFVSNSKSAAADGKIEIKKTPVQTRTAMSPSPTPRRDYEVLLEFGGKGTSAGLFERPSEITVDDDGFIYVSDRTRRIQRFDANGKFVNLWNVEGGKNDRIEKLAAGADGNVYALIAGRIAVFDRETGGQKQLLTDSRRSYINDFQLRDDGGMMLAAAASAKTEEIIHLDKNKRDVQRFSGIHSRAAETPIPPSAVRLAVDGKGDIYAVYALGAIYGIFSYNEEDLMTFHFTAQGKFVNKFAAGLHPAAIATDNQSHIYLLNNKPTDKYKIVVFADNGSEIKRVAFNGFGFIETMALDRQNNIYIISGDKVSKLKAFSF